MINYKGIWQFCLIVVFVTKMVSALDVQAQASIPDEIQNNEEFAIPIIVTNTDTEAHQTEITVQIYRGSKRYWNQTITYFLESKEVFTHEFTGTVALEPGIYKCKVMIRKDNQKTTHDIIKEVNVTGAWKQTKPEAPKSSASDLYRQRKTALYLLLALSIGLNIVLIWKR